MILHCFRYPKESSENAEGKGPAGTNALRIKLLLLHGMGGTGSLWRPIAASLEEVADLLAPDQRGHGESRLPPEETRYAPLDFAEDVRDTCEATEFHPAWVIGHSMGVRTACGYAKLCPDWVEGLILVDLGFSGLAGGGIGEALAVFLADLPSTFPTRAEAKAFLAEHCPDPSIAQYLLAVARVNLKDGSITFPFDSAGLLKTIEDSRGTAVGPWMEAFARETGKPVYVIRGAESGVYSKSDYEAEKARYAEIPNVQFLEMPGAGHGLPFEKRLEFVALVRKWTGLESRL